MMSLMQHKTKFWFQITFVGIGEMKKINVYFFLKMTDMYVICSHNIRKSFCAMMQNKTGLISVWLFTVYIYA